MKNIYYILLHNKLSFCHNPSSHISTVSIIAFNCQCLLFCRSHLAHEAIEEFLHYVF